MPPRYAYWTIIAGGLPTAFRMTEREELLPTFKRIKQKHPDAEMKYFARGRLWGSPEEARAESERLRAEADARRGRTTQRGRAWRPGGEHQDPRQKFKDAKKVRNQDRRQERFDRRHKAGAPPSGGDDAPSRPTSQSTGAPRTEWRDRPRSDQPPQDSARPDRPRQDDRGDRGFRGKPPVARDRPWNDRGPRTARPPASGGRPWSDRPPQDSARPDRPRQDDRGDRGFRGKPPVARDRPWNDRGPRTARPPASGGRPWSDRPPQDSGRQDRPFRGTPTGGDNRRPSTRPAPRSGPKPGGSHGSPKGSWARKPESKSRTSGPGGRPPGKPARGGSDRGPAKDRRRR
jgi:hypothetical protein